MGPFFNYFFSAHFPGDISKDKGIKYINSFHSIPLGTTQNLIKNSNQEYLFISLITLEF